MLPLKINAILRIKVKTITINFSSFSYMNKFVSYINEKKFRKSYRRLTLLLTIKTGFYNL